MAWLGLILAGQIAAAAPADRVARMDDRGVLRWQDDRSEVALFGVNYYAPCSVSYSNLKLLGVDHKEAVDRDVAHFVRMGLDALRLHVFDREISDKQGNLLDNHHLEVLDYLIARAREHGIYTVLTPIAWWGTPEPEQGFSSLYAKPEMVHNPDARQAQVNYFRQFMSHRNPYTGLTYAEDPAVIAIELINELLYSPETTDDDIVGYVNEMYDAVRSTGAQQPIFHNCWAGREKVLPKSKLQGSTFGWYPSGLGAGRSLTRNFLPVVNDYPRARMPEFDDRARIVYEFDAADIPGSYIYPAMARAFRSGGIQIATQFQYDPVDTAPYNSDWGTHYLSLIYTPHEAVSFVIAGEAFRTLPRLKTYGDYPQSCSFGPFRASYEGDLSLMLTDEKLMYSNDTDVEPPDAAKLRQVVGCGSSPVVRYEGTGAYFLDKVKDGVWRLDVYPDAVWAQDPYGSGAAYMTATGRRKVAVAFWRERRMEISLPDLGDDFTLRRTAPDPAEQIRAEDGAAQVTPGRYLVSRRGADKPQADALPVPFVAPRPDEGFLAVRHDPPAARADGQPWTIEATVAHGGEARVSAHIWTSASADPRTFALDQVGPYEHRAVVPAAAMARGEIRYCLSVQADERRNFPGDWTGDPAEAWDPSERAHVLYDAAQGPPSREPHIAAVEKATCHWEMAPRAEDGKALHVAATSFEEKGCVAFSQDVEPPPDPDRYGAFVISARGQHLTNAVEVALVEQDGAGWGYDVPLSDAWGEIRVPFDRLRRLWSGQPRRPNDRLQVDQLARVQLCFGAWLFGHHSDRSHALEIARVALEPPARTWSFKCGIYEPITLWSPWQHLPENEPKLREAPPQRLSSRRIDAAAPGAKALRMEVKGFGEKGHVGLRRQLNLRGYVLDRYDTLHVRARGSEPTTAVEIALVEHDGAGWGYNVPVTTEWRDVRVPFSDLFRLWGGEPREPNDRFHPERLQAVNICFGAWLYDDQRDADHALELEVVVIEAGGNGQ